MYVMFIHGHGFSRPPMADRAFESTLTSYYATYKLHLTIQQLSQCKDAWVSLIRVNSFIVMIFFDLVYLGPVVIGHHG